jgi:hypothetical protein
MSKARSNCSGSIQRKSFRGHFAIGKIAEVAGGIARVGHPTLQRAGPPCRSSRGISHDLARVAVKIRSQLQGSSQDVAQQLLVRYAETFFTMFYTRRTILQIVASVYTVSTTIDGWQPLVVVCDGFFASGDSG